MAVEDNWSIDDGIWDTWDTHWTPVDETWTTALDLVTTPLALINWRNYTQPVALGPLLLPNVTQINLRWRVEPLPIDGMSTVPAVMNLRHIINPTPLGPSTTTFAQINWRYILNPVALGGMVVPFTQINLRWRVEPAPLSGIVEFVCDPGYWTMTGSEFTDAISPAAGPLETSPAYIQTQAFAATDVARNIRVLSEDRIIKVKAEDRAIRVFAEDRIIKVG